MMRGLELNDEVDDGVDWRGLLGRVQRRLELRSVQRAQAAPVSPADAAQSSAATMTSITTKSAPVGPEQAVVSRVGTMKSSFSRRRPEGNRPVDENQRALDRLSYLGGILIPLPIISSILSMGDVYGPDGTRFFVFWAVSVPLAVLAVVLIYADTIRKAEVWVEIGAEHVVPTPPAGKSVGNNTDTSGASSGGNVSPVKVEVKHSVTWQRRLAHDDDDEDDDHGEQPAPRRQGSEPFAVDHDMEERIIDMPPAVAAAAAASVYPVGEGALAWLPPWTMGWDDLPSVILERPSDGSKPKAWKRGQLGWAGAIQTVLSKKFRDGSDVPDGVAAYERRVSRRKANSY
jgi:hypothetical protein